METVNDAAQGQQCEGGDAVALGDASDEQLVNELIDRYGWRWSAMGLRPRWKPYQMN